jgi:Fur family ferric uptake transcriptional regulator
LHKDGDLVQRSDDEALEALRASGKRITPQRSLLLEIIRQSDAHLDADEIYHLARRKDPRISLSTVYRNLNLLKELGLVNRLHLDEEHHHYELRDEADHYHLICSSCGRVIEFDSDLVAQLVANVGKDKDFVIERAHVDLTGICPECRAKKAQ